MRWVDPEGVERLRVFRLKADADDFAVNVEHTKRTGVYVDPTAGRITFKEYAERWRQVQPHRESTREQVESYLRNHVYPTLGSRPLAAIRPTEIQALIRERSDKLAPATLETVSRWLRTVFRAAVADRIIARSPAVDLRLPAAPERDPVVPFSTDELRALEAGLPAKMRAIVPVGYGLGLRSGEALGLTVDRVDFLRRQVTVDRQLLTPRQPGPPTFGPPKTRKSRRVVPLPDSIGDRLAAHIAEHGTGPDGLLFTTPRGLAWRRPRWAEKWQQAVATAKLPKGVRFHRLRHTYASLLIQAGCSVVVVQHHLGHATAQETLDTYSHMWPDDDDRTRDAVDLLFRSDPDRTAAERAKENRRSER